MRLHLLSAAWADQQYSVGHEHVKKNHQPAALQSAAVQCNYNISIRVQNLLTYLSRKKPLDLTVINDVDNLIITITTVKTCCSTSPK